jgi:chromosome segregation ATPase
MGGVSMDEHKQNKGCFEDFIFIKSELKDLKREIEALQNNKIDKTIWLTDLSALEKEFLKLSSHFEELIRDREDDKQQYQYLIKEFGLLKNDFNELKIHYVEIGKDMKYTVETLKEVRKDVTDIKKNKTIDLDKIKQTIFGKIAYYVVLSVMCLLPISMLIFFLTGENVIKWLSDFLK